MVRYVCYISEIKWMEVCFIAHMCAGRRRDNDGSAARRGLAPTLYCWTADQRQTAEWGYEGLCTATSLWTLQLHNRRLLRLLHTPALGTLQDRSVRLLYLFISFWPLVTKPGGILLLWGEIVWELTEWGKFLWDCWMTAMITLNPLSFVLSISYF